jgi:hypothetical protein
MTMAADESKMSIIESFLLVHYKGEHSVHPSVRAAEGISGHVVAHFFNTIGRVAAEGEWSFPMGGYYNLYKETAVTRELLLELREIARLRIGGGSRSAATETSATVMKDAQSFKAWYSSREGQASDAYAMLRSAVVKSVQQFCAQLYQPGGRLHYAAVSRGTALPKVADFRVRWLPQTVLHSILWRLCSKTTKSWIRKAKVGDTLNVAQGFKSECDDLTGEVGIYTGNYMLQLGKAFSLYVRALTSGVDPTELPLARKARYNAVKNATRLRKHRSVAVTDDLFVDAVRPLDLAYSWDATLFGAMCDSETLALRRMEVYQQDRRDCQDVPDGERVTLPKTKADQQAEGFTRLKRHCKNCEFAHDAQLGWSQESACGTDAEGNLDGRTRCQVCAKRHLKLYCTR